MLATACCVLIFKNFAQTEHAKNSLSVSTGLAVPVFNFGSTNQYSQSVGYAKLGENLNITFEHALTKQWGLLAMLYGSRNTINTATLASQLDKRAFANAWLYSFNAYQSPPPPPQYLYTYYPNWRVDNNSWYNLGALVGPGLHLPLSKASRLSFTASVAVGAVYISMPKLNAYSATDTSAAHITQSGAAAVAPAIFVSTGLNYRLNKKLSFVLNLGYFASGNALFYNIKESLALQHGSPNNLPSNYSYYEETLISPQVQWVSILNINAGMAISL